MRDVCPLELKKMVIPLDWTPMKGMKWMKLKFRGDFSIYGDWTWCDYNDRMVSIKVWRFLGFKLEDHGKNQRLMMFSGVNHQQPATRKKHVWMPHQVFVWDAIMNNQGDCLIKTNWWRIIVGISHQLCRLCNSFTRYGPWFVGQLVISIPKHTRWQ